MTVDVYFALYLSPIGVITATQAIVSVPAVIVALLIFGVLATLLHAVASLLE